MRSTALEFNQFLRGKLSKYEMNVIVAKLAAEN